MSYHKRNKLVHGYKARKHPLYSVWAGMKTRCYNTNCSQYHDYGGRGITVSPEWMSFENFANDMFPRPTEDHSIDRIDNDSGYSKENCKWSTRCEQASNKRRYKTNKTGLKGVHQKPNGTFIAHFSHEGTKYNLAGSYLTADEAHAVRLSALKLLENGFENVKPLLERRARMDSTTGVRGISRHADGGYVVRATLKGQRLYLGYFKSFDDAKECLENAKA